jgi:Zn-finger nucleic acid-binding protein
MQTAIRQGVEIDRCPACRGVWLDRGELEKLVALGGDDDQPRYEQSIGEEDAEPDPADKLSSRRSFFAELFDVE